MNLTEYDFIVVNSGSENQEEANIFYVAVTRAKKTLVRAR